MPKGSSNVAEYKAFHSLLNYLDSTVEGANILIIGDSMLVVNQMNGTQGIRKGAYKPFALSAREQLGISQTKNKFTIKWVYREQNSIADDLSKCS
jgi:ribonuclease HI